MSDRPYSRLYWELLSEFSEVASDCELMGAYALLLIGADMAWDGKESNPFLPRHIKDTTLARLVALKLVEVTEPTYAIRGLVKERARRSALASKASNARWTARSNAPRMQTYALNADSNADSNASADGHRMPRRDEKRREEKSSSTPKPDAASVFYDLNGGQASPKALRWVDEMASEYTDERVIEAMAANASEGRVDLKATQSALALAANQRRKDAEARRQAKDAEYQRRLQAKEDDATPEEQARAAKLKDGIADFLRGTA